MCKNKFILAGEGKVTLVFIKRFSGLAVVIKISYLNT
jgi:formylmethanofuran dehydrogenase subunit E